MQDNLKGGKWIVRFVDVDSAAKRHCEQILGGFSIFC